MHSDKDNTTSKVTEPSPSHMDRMCEIFKSGQAPHHEKFPDIFCKADDHQAIHDYLQGFSKPRNPFRTRSKFTLAWFEESQVNGYLLYHLYKTSDIFFGKNRWMCFIEDIAVHEDSRSKGGASLMLDHLMAELNALGNCLVSAQVWRNNEASEALFTKYEFLPKSKNFYCVLK